jgi:DNA-binding CsgD family transcriptional regulator
VPIPEKLSEGAKRFALSKRETEAIVLIATGNPWKIVASKMGVSIRTVEFHLYNARLKIKGAASTLEALIRMLL